MNKKLEDAAAYAEAARLRNKPPCDCERCQQEDKLSEVNRMIAAEMGRRGNAKRKMEGSAEETLLYIVDCTLGTIESMASLKATPKGKYLRQINIAQVGYDCLGRIGADLKGSRCYEIGEYGSVRNWARRLEEMKE